MIDHHAFPTLSTEAIRAMRDTRFCGGEIDGIRFIRCAPRLGPCEAYHLAKEIRLATGDTEGQVTHAHNPDYAEHDYLRIAKGSKAFGLICAMKS